MGYEVYKTRMDFFSSNLKNLKNISMNTGEKGFEPLTFGFGDHYSTIETIPLFYLFFILDKKGKNIRNFYLNQNFF